MQWYGSGRNAFCAMEPILDPSVKKVVIVTRVGTSKNNGVPWAHGALCFKGQQFVTWVNVVEGENPHDLVVGKTYDVYTVTLAKRKTDDDIVYRSYVKPNPSTQSEESGARYKLTKSNALYLRRYAEHFQLGTEGHWRHRALEHLIETAIKFELIPGLANYSAEK